MTTTQEHITISGHRVAFDKPQGKLRDFVERVRSATEDPKVTENELITLIYSDENPMLAPGIVPGRGMVTKETLADPLYRVLQDLLDRKRITEKRIDVDAMASRYTVSVTEAARELDMHVSGVRQAVQTGRIPSWIKDGAHYITPEGLASFKPERRGPKAAPKRGGMTRVSSKEAVEKVMVSARKVGERAAPAVREAAENVRAQVEEVAKAVTFRIGGAPGSSMRLKAAKLVDEKRSGSCLEGKVAEPWKRIGVLSIVGDKARFFVLVPSPSWLRVGSSELYVDGPFKVASKVNNARLAREAWNAFEAK